MVEGFVVDSDGVIVGKELLDIKDDNSGYILTPLPAGIHMPIWNGSEWVEGLSAEEIKEVRDSNEKELRTQSLKLSDDERIEMLEQAILFLSME